MYKIVKDDAQIVYIGKEDGSLLSVDRKFFNFLPEVGQEVQVFQSGDEFVILPVEKLDTISKVNTEKSDKYKVVAGIFALFLGYFAGHSLYLKREMAWLRLVCSIVLLFLWVSIFAREHPTEGQLAFAGLCFLIYQGMGIWGIIEGILILISKKGSKWHQDGFGKELLD